MAKDKWASGFTDFCFLKEAYLRLHLWIDQSSHSDILLFPQNVLSCIFIPGGVMSIWASSFSCGKDYIFTDSPPHLVSLWAKGVLWCLKSILSVDFTSLHHPVRLLQKH